MSSNLGGTSNSVMNVSVASSDINKATKPKESSFKEGDYVNHCNIKVKILAIQYFDAYDEYMAVLDLPTQPVVLVRTLTSWVELKHYWDDICDDYKTKYGLD
jgi:hypothetical protein